MRAAAFKTSSGPVFLARRAVAVVPRRVALVRLRDLDRRSAGYSSKIVFAEIAALSPLEARDLYWQSMLAGVSAVVVRPSTAKAMVEEVSDLAARTRSFAGLESLFLTGLAAAGKLGDSALVDAALGLWDEVGPPGRLGGGVHGVMIEPDGLVTFFNSLGGITGDGIRGALLDGHGFGGLLGGGDLDDGLDPNTGKTGRPGSGNGKPGGGGPGDKVDPNTGGIGGPGVGNGKPGGGPGDKLDPNTGDGHPPIEAFGAYFSIAASLAGNAAAVALALAGCGLARHFVRDDTSVQPAAEDDGVGTGYHLPFGGQLPPIQYPPPPPGSSGGSHEPPPPPPDGGNPQPPPDAGGPKPPPPPDGGGHHISDGDHTGGGGGFVHGGHVAGFPFVVPGRFGGGDPDPLNVKVDVGQGVTNLAGQLGLAPEAMRTVVERADDFAVGGVVVSTPSVLAGPGLMAAATHVGGLSFQIALPRLSSDGQLEAAGLLQGAVET